MAPFDRAVVVSCRLSIVTVALSVTIRPQFVIECLRRSDQQGVGSLLAKISGCSPWSRPLMFGTAESEHPRLTNGEIIYEEFQPVWSQSTKLQTDGQTRRHAIARPHFELTSASHFKNESRNMGHSPTWGRPAPQVRLEIQFRRGVVVDQVLSRFSLCWSLPKIFAIKVESCQKSRQIMDVFAVPNFVGVGPSNSYTLVITAASCHIAW